MLPSETGVVNAFQLKTEASEEHLNQRGIIGTTRVFQYFNFETIIPNRDFDGGGTFYENELHLDFAYSPEPSAEPYVEDMRQSRPGHYKVDGSVGNRQRPAVLEWDKMSRTTPPPAFRAVAGPLLIIEIGRLIGTSYKTYIDLDFINKFNDQKLLVKTVLQDVNNASVAGKIPPQFQNQESLMKIANYILEGVINTDDQELINVAKKITSDIFDIDIVVPSGLDNYEDRTYRVLPIDDIIRDEQDDN